MGYLIYKFDEIRKVSKQPSKVQMAFELSDNNVKILQNLEDKSGSLRDSFNNFLTFDFKSDFIKNEKEKIIDSFEKSSKGKVSLFIEIETKEELQKLRDENNVPFNRLLNYIISLKD